MTRSTRAKTLGDIPFQIDTSAKDYEGIRTALLRFVSTVTPEWTDLQPSDPGVVLLEAMAFVADTMAYHVDRAQNEMYLTTAQERTNVQQLLRLIGYEMKSGTASSVPLCVITNADDVVIPAGTRVSTQGGSESFEFLEDIHLPFAGVYAPSSVKASVQDLLALPVTTVEDLVAVYGVTYDNEVLGESDGSAYQTFTLENSPVSISADITSSIRVITDNGEQYSISSTFLDADPDSLVCTYRINDFGVVSLTFGDGVSGKIPDVGSTITASYRVGVGTSTNSFGVNTLTKLNGPTIAGIQRVFNPVQPSGGQDAESISDAKRNGPLSLRALDRAITLQDFETLATLTPSGGVKIARASNIDPYDVVVYVASEGSNPIPSGRWFPRAETGTGMLGAVGRWLSSKKPVATRIDVRAPVPVTPMLRATIQAQASILNAEVERNVRVSLLNLFQQSTEMFGIGIPISRVMQVIENSTGVDFVNILEFHRVPSLYGIKGTEDARVNAQINVSSMSPSTNRGRYVITWRSPTQYTLRVEGYGVIRSSYASTRPILFDADTEYSIYHYNSSANSETAERSLQFRLTVTLSNTRPSLGDEWGFAIDRYVGNMVLDASEIVLPPIISEGVLDSTLVILSTTGGI